MKEWWILGMSLLGVMAIGIVDADNYRRAPRYNYGLKKPYRGWYLYQASESYMAKPVRRRVWWSEQWWGLGWSLYPHYWTYGRAAKLGLSTLAEEGRWDEIEGKIQREITALTENRTVLENQNRIRHGIIIATMNKQLDQLRQYLKDAREYSTTSIEHTPEERQTRH